MQETTNGWVVITHNHGRTKREFMVTSTFARTRKESIQLFISGSGEGWKYLFRKFNYRCVKATSTITISYRPI